jgi:hypothetical protein
MSQSYKTAKFVIVTLEVFGWLIFALGFVFLAVSAFATHSMPSSLGGGYGAGPYIGFAFAFGCFVAGLSLVAGSQLLRAQVNMANDTARMRELMEAERNVASKGRSVERKEPVLRSKA